MRDWIKSSKKQGKRTTIDTDLSLVENTGNEAESESSDDTADDTVEAEKKSFDKKVFDESSSKSFFEDNPFNAHSSDTYKSVFVTRLSLTPLTSRQARSRASTPKRNRSPSPDLVNGIKSIRKQ